MGDQSAGDSLRYCEMNMRNGIVERVPNPVSDPVVRIAVVKGSAREPYFSVWRHRDRTNRNMVSLKRRHEDRLVDEPIVIGWNRIRVSKSKRECLFPRSHEPMKQIRIPSNLAGGPHSGDPPVSIGVQG